MSRPRIEVRKTYELWVGGRFDRSESGRRDRVNDRAGRHAGNFPRASRKDVRDAVEAARAAPGDGASPRRSASTGGNSSGGMRNARSSPT